MSKVFKLIEIVGTSATGYEDAINNAIQHATKSLQGISWFEVVQQRGAVEDGKVTEYQVILKVGFKLIQ